MEERARRIKIPARVLIYRLSRTLIHSVCVYTLRGRVLVYDAVKGTTFLPTNVNFDAPALSIVRHLVSGITEAWWFEDTPDPK